ncbi:MAG: tetratricopeptide repeat protein [Burkholderiaceae bacterium]|nr:tetratricopeptide repeat protein [Burkholderiaceae bacterium]
MALAAALAAGPLYAQIPPAPSSTGLRPDTRAQRSAETAANASLMYELLLAEFNYQAGDPQAGHRFMLDAARRTGDEALYRRATEMAIHARFGPDALETARAWRAAHPESADAGRYELQLLLALGRAAETEAPLRAILATLPEKDREDFLAALPTLYARAAGPDEIARLVEHALQDVLQDPKNPALSAAAWTAVGRLRLRAGDKAGALAAATLGQNADVSSRWPPLLALQLAEGGEPGAQALIERHLQNPQPYPQVQLGYARWLIDEGRLADAHAQLAAAIGRDPEFAQAWLLQGALYAQQRQNAQAEHSLEKYLTLLQLKNSDGEEGMDNARLMLARIAQRSGDTARAQALLDQIDSPEQAFAVASERAAMLVQQGRLDDALAAIDAVPEEGPRDARLKLLAQCQLLRENGRAGQSYQLLTAQLQNDPDDQDLLYDSAMSADRMGDLEKMESLLRRLIALKPGSYTALNALGYSLADRGVRLDEARALIEKAVQLSPGNAFIQDSLGWVHFRLGHIEEAARILAQAYERQPDPEIAAHLGEVLWVQGHAERARAVWTEGLRQDPDNDTLKQTLARLQVKLTP